MELTYEQEQAARNYARVRGLNEDEVISAMKELGERFRQIIEDVKSVIRRVTQDMRPYIYAYNRYIQEQRVKFYRKKKSQRKKWSKWKKRRGW